MVDIALNGTGVIDVSQDPAFQCGNPVRSNR